MNVKRLDGRQLNYWVARSAGLKLADQSLQPGARHDPESGVWHPHTYNPANDWSQAGPILSGEWYGIEDALTEWFGSQWPQVPTVVEAPLKWFMRAYVATQFGDEVEDAIPFPLAQEEPVPPARSRASNQAAGPGSKVSGWFRQINW
jgi:hypothetical protein